MPRKITAHHKALSAEYGGLRKLELLQGQGKIPSDEQVKQAEKWAETVGTSEAKDFLNSIKRRNSLPHA